MKIKSMQDQDKKNFVQSFIEQEKTFQLDAFDLEQITKEIYGNSIEMLESPNDTTHEYSIDGNNDKDGQEKLNLAITRGHLEYWGYDCILNDLCTKGFIEPGKYFLRMSW